MRRWWRYRTTVLILCTLAFFATMVARLSISPVITDISAEFHVSTGAIGAALSGMWATYALAQFPSGLLGDRFGSRRIILLALGLTGTASLLLSLSNSYLLFVVSTLVLGAGAGLHYSVATNLLADYFDDVGRAVGIHVAGGPLAGLVAPVLAAAIAVRYNWHAAVLLGGAIAIPLFVAFAWRIRETSATNPARSFDNLVTDDTVTILGRADIRYTVALAVGGAFVWQATASFLPAFLVEYREFGRTTAGLLFSAYFIVHGVTQPIMGGLSDRYGRDAATSITMICGVFAYGLLVFGNDEVSAVAATLLAGVAMSWGAPVQSRFIDQLGTKRTVGFGLVRTVYMVLGAAGSVVVGMVADLVGWALAFGLLAGIMIGGLSLLQVNRQLGLGY